MTLLNKVQPQAVDLEKVVLGAILIEKEAIHNVSDLLKPDMFYHDHHQAIYNAMIQMQLAGEPIDIMTLCEYLKSQHLLEKAGGNHYVTTLTNYVVSSANIKKHAQIIVQKWMKREQIRISGVLMQGAYEDTTDPFEIQEQAERDLHDLWQSINHKEAQKIDSVVIRVLQRIEELRHRDSHLIGITSGYSSIDRITMGWQKTDLIIVAARPAVGKSAFTLSLAANAAFANYPIAFFSLEMSAEQLTERLLASTSKMYLSTIKSCQLDDHQMNHLYTKGVQKVAGLPFYIDDTASLTVGQFKARLRRMVRRYGVKFCVVDYLQLLKSSLGKNANRQQQIGEISRELKIAAKELGVPIIALSQLSREVEKHSRTPQLSDLREAGDIEQDADMVCFLYGHTESEILGKPELADNIYFKIAKHRNGALGNFKFTYAKDFQIFTEDGAAPEFKPVKSFADADNPF